MALKGFFNILLRLFGRRKSIKLGFYGPVNAGKTSLANLISKEFTGEEMGTASKIPHETREIKVKEKVSIKKGKKELNFNLIDTPGIATKIDYTDFLKHGIKAKEAKERAKEATQGVIESIKWLENTGWRHRLG